MPVPGPRNQFRDLTVRNPDGERMRFFERVLYHGFGWLGRSPATMERTLRGNVLAAGQVRRLWRQTINYIPGADTYSWTSNGPQPDRPTDLPVQGFEITRALRYMTRSVYLWGGTDNTRLSEAHTTVRPRNRGPHGGITTGGGQKRYAPTLRNRLTSFGARVPPLNPRVSAAEDYSTGGQ